MDRVFDSGWTVIQRKLVVYSREFYEREYSEGKT
jgi:hypothetical protein